MKTQNTDIPELMTYFRSSAAYRVRIALNLKGVGHRLVPVHLLKNGGEQFKSEFIELNPMALVPVWKDGNGTITQSLAIIEYIDEIYPGLSLLPESAVARARVRALALSIACDIHPLNNLRVLNFLTETLAVSQQDKMVWYRNWIDTGFKAVEKMLLESSEKGRFCYGDSPTLADCCLVPQVFNANRFDCDMSKMPRLMSIYQSCIDLPAFKQAHPSSQPDCE